MGQKATSIQSRFHKEISTIVEQGKSADEKDIKEMLQLHAFIKELLRKHPLTYFSLTHAVVQTVNLGGHDIPTNANMDIYLPTISEDPRLWTELKIFRPERLLTGGTTVKMIPFGEGRRIYLVLVMGTLHISLMMVRMVQAFEWFAQPEKPKLDFSSKLEFTVVMS